MRLTRERDKYECRIAGGCPAEDWMYDLYREYPVDCCYNCPFEIFINKLSLLEDFLEKNNINID